MVDILNKASTTLKQVVTGEAKPSISLENKSLELESDVGDLNDFQLNQLTEVTIGSVKAIVIRTADNHVYALGNKWYVMTPYYDDSEFLIHIIMM
jgi:hypothetical protein